MPLFGHKDNNTNTSSNTGTNAGTGAHTESDPMYNNELGQAGNPMGPTGNNQIAGYHVPGVGMVSPQQAEQIQAINFQNNGALGAADTNPTGGYQDMGMGMGGGHQNNAMPQGGIAQGTGVPLEGDPTYDNSRGHVMKRGAEGAAVGGVAGHEGQHGHTKRDAALGAAGGAAYEHEHHKHQNQNQNQNTMGSGGNYDNNNNMSSGAGTGTGMGGMGGGSGVASNQNQTSGGGNIPNAAEAKNLERSGKIDKVLGTLTGSAKLKEEGLQKQADAAALREQAHHLNVAQELEAEAQMRRGHAVGIGADPSHATAGGPQQGVNSGIQPSYGTGQGAVTGMGVGGGGYGGIR